MCVVLWADRASVQVCATQTPRPPSVRRKKARAGTQRCKVFYCDPYVSNQKGRLEKNHEYIRYVIPKGRSMYKYTQEDINLMASHINSTARDSLNGATPFDLAELLLDKKIPN